MTAEEMEYRTRNIEFFDDAVLRPGLALSKSWLPWEKAPITYSLALMESTLWLRLGTELQFFEREAVSERLLTTAPFLTRAWTTLVEHEVSLPEGWCDFVSGESKPRIDVDKFFASTEQALSYWRDQPAPLDGIDECFSNLLLLTSEVLFEPSTMHFLQYIGWGNDESWASLRRGMPGSWPSLLSVYRGFADHITYFDSIFAYIFRFYRQSGQRAFAHLLDVVIFMVGQRCVIDRDYARIRALDLGGEIAAFVDASGPEAKLKYSELFEQIMGASQLPGEQGLSFWPHFVRSLEATTNTRAANLKGMTVQQSLEE